MNSLLKPLTTILHGVAIGIANIIPGISGGTIAVILNIYDQLITDINTLISNLLKSPLKGVGQSKKELSFLIQISLGAAIGILLFSKVCDILFTHYPSPTYFCLIGLILGSIPVIIKSHTNMTITPKKSIFFIIGALPVLAMAFLPTTNNLEPLISASKGFSTTELAFIGLAGVIAAGSMIIPGLSGSLILVLMGIYSDVIQAISELNMIFLGTLGIGAILGLIFISKAIKWCLSNHPGYTYYAILGLIIGSVPIIWPEYSATLPNIVLYITTFLIGIALSLQLGKSFK